MTIAQLNDDCLLPYDVLVRADGVPGPLPANSTSFQRHVTHKRSLQIVDFNDQFHRLAKRNSQLRKGSYLKFGYEVNGGPEPIYPEKHDSRARELFTPYAHSSSYFARPLANLGRSEPEHQYQARQARHRKSHKSRRVHGRLSIGELDRERLFDAYRKLRREGGLSPGVDGISLLDISPSRMGEILGQFAETVRSGLWSPQATRPVNIPKHGSDEFRTIQLSSLLDRILYRALYDLVSPEFDRKFSPQSYGLSLIHI